MKKVSFILVIFILLSGNIYAHTIQDKYRWRNDDGSETSATWKADENTAIYYTGTENLRLRFQFYMHESSAYDNYLELYYSVNTGGPWTKITSDGSSNHFVLSESDNFTDQETTTGQLTQNIEHDFVSGKMIESSDTFSFTLVSQSTEYEICIKPTGNAENHTYYFKLFNTTHGDFESYVYPVMAYKLIFVDASASGSNDGTSWANAYTSLQSALDVSISGDQIWVAKGIYKPSKESDNTMDEPRKFTFQLKNGVEIYGGFVGTETSLSQRDFYVNETILSGDINGDDVVTGTGESLSFSNNNENCYHVFYHDNSGVNSSAVLDGLTISGGNANGRANHDYGAGIYNEQCNPTLKNIIFKNNQSATGVLYLYDLSTGASLSNLIFENNDGGYYGALYIEGSTGTSILTNALMINNKGEYGGGLYNSDSPTTINNATFSGNYASSSGGGVYSTSSVLTLNNCIIWNNSAGGEGNEIYHSGSITTLNNCCYKDDDGDIFGSLTIGDGNIASDPLFVDANDGNMTLYGTSPFVDTGDDTYNTLLTDIRGGDFGRKLSKVDGNAGTIDMGAYEYKFGVDPATENKIPTSNNAEATINEDNDKIFTSMDFPFNDLDTDPADELQSVEITTLPSLGTIYLDGNNNNEIDNDEALDAQDEIEVANIAKLKYRPVANKYGTPYTAFTFKVSDGKNYSEDSYTMTINVNPVNDAPENTTVPTITPVGTIRIGGTIGATVGEWNDDDDNNQIEVKRK
ncbi:MAG: hypothetical protein JXR48_01605 [Candidatus Delongbacteria bacterium]|nr:hypothetical protein [Candidatus Delongbacteria bacterium]MBN2833639.1 hypothetical protein [Candidatus Delongbacteria bacterium]